MMNSKTQVTGAPTAGTTPDELREQLVEARRLRDEEHDARARTYDQYVQLRQLLVVAAEQLGAERYKVASLEARLHRVQVQAWLLILACAAVAALVTV